MNEHEMVDLLERAGAGLDPDVSRLVAGGAARGRARRRRRRGGAALGGLAAAAVVGTLLILPGGGDDGGTPVATDPTPSAPVSTAPAEPTPSEPVTVPLTVAAADIPAIVADVLGGEVSPALTEPPYPVVDQRRLKVAHFRYDGALTTAVIEPESSMAGCRAQVRENGGGATCTVEGDHEVLRWGPTTNDGVTAQGASVWTNGWIVSLLSYNAAEGKDVAPLTPEPPIAIDRLVELAVSEVWFT